MNKVNQLYKAGVESLPAGFKVYEGSAEHHLLMAAAAMVNAAAGILDEPGEDPEVGALVEEGLREKVAQLEWALEASRAEVARLRTERNQACASLELSLQRERHACRRVTEVSHENAALVANVDELRRAMDHKPASPATVVRSAIDRLGELAVDVQELANEAAEACEALRIIGRPLDSRFTPVAWANQYREIGEKLQAALRETK